MSHTPRRNRATKLIATLVAAASFAGVAAVGTASPAAAAIEAAPAIPVQPPYNNCSSPCIILAEIDTSGPTVKFRGETKYINGPSQWYLTVRRNGVVVTTYASPYLQKNRLDVDLGALPAGGAYEMWVLAGTTGGDQLLVKPFTTGPAVTATPTATNVKLGFTMPVGVTASAYVRRTDGTIVASASSTGAGKTHTLSTAAVLNPTTAYTYQVSAWDAQGRLYTKVGAFQTRSVRLEVQLSGLQINNDSDSFGAGELRAQMHVGGTKRWIWQNEKSVETAWGAKYFAVSTSAALPSAVRTVPIHVVVADNDCEGIGSLCTGGLGDLKVGSGTVSDSQWATASVTATLPNTTTSTGWTPFITTVNNPVGFTVTGSYRWVMV